MGGEGGSVLAFEAAVFAGDLLQGTLDGGCGFALTFPGGLFVEFTTTDFGEDAGFLAGALETAHGDFKRFVLFNAYVRHLFRFLGSVKLAQPGERRKFYSLVAPFAKGASQFGG
jgi:hypothetical protein